MSKTVNFSPIVDEASPIGQKWLAAGGSSALGQIVTNAQSMPDGIGSYQEFANGTIFYSVDFGAVLIAKPIYDKLNSTSVAGAQTADGQIIRDYLGYPTGDSFPISEKGGEAAYFQQGMIVARVNQEARVVYGMIYLHYRELGNIVQGATNAPVVGLPISDEQSIANGRCSQFDSGTIYWSADTGAWETHGAIRGRYVALGGPGGLLGFPTSDELPVLDGKNYVGRYNTFQGGLRAGLPTGQCRIYWSGSTGAWEVYGAIGTLWLQSGGPLGSLGFPTSGETDTPGQGRFNSFENGVIVWHGSGPYNKAFAVQGLQLNVFSYADASHSDFNVQINITDSTGQVNHGRDPAGGNYSNGNQQFNPFSNKLSIAKVTPTYTLDVWMLCIHEKTFGKDDEDGTVTAHFDIDNVWGVLDSPNYSNGGFKVVMKPTPEPETVTTDPSLFRTNLFWPFHNFDTDPLTWETYSETFADVGAGDASFNLGTILPWNWHLFERAFYQFVYRTLAKPGNCFGMCLEALYARDLLTPFVEPIFSSPDNTYRKDGKPADPSSPGDAAVIAQVNIKHGYQLGAGMIEWFLGKWTAGALHDPVRAFRESRDAFGRGDWPILSLSSDNELSMDGHSVVPYLWDPPTEDAINAQPHSGQTWTIYAANPNYPLVPNSDPHCRVTIDPFYQVFTFHKDDGPPWTGTNSSGGRLLSIPFSQLNYEPVTLGNAIFALILGGIVVICAGNGQTTQITDETGKTFYSPSSSAIDRRAAVPEQGATHVINPDVKTRIPGMISVPLTDANKKNTRSTAKNAASLSKRVNRRTQSARIPVGVLTDDTAELPFEVYYIKRLAPGFKWSELKLTASRSSTTATVARQSSPASKTQQPGNTRPIAPIHLLNPIAPQPTLTFKFAASGSSAYQWAIFSPRMSINMASEAVAAEDVITIGQPGTGSQSFAIRADQNARARKFTISVAGWRGDYTPQARSYVLDSLSIQPGQSLIVSVGDGGKELWLNNLGVATTCNLTIYAGGGTQAASKNPNVSLDAGKIFRIRPVNWNPATMLQAVITMDVLDATGKIVRQVTL
jgi:hypothetical protein